MTQKPQEESGVHSESRQTPPPQPQATDSYQNDLDTLLKKLPTHSERSVIIEIMNEATTPLALAQFSLSRGRWKVKPPSRIMSGGAAFFAAIAGKHRAFLAKIVGQVQFSVIGTSTASSLVVLNFYTKPNEKLRFDSYCPSDYALVVRKYKLKKKTEAHNYVKVTVKENFLAASTLSKSKIVELRMKTYFDRRELQELYKYFHQIAQPQPYLTREKFAKLFPEIDSNVLINSLFVAFDRVQNPPDDVISFEDFVIALSVMSRGSPSEKAQLAFSICDLSDDQQLDRIELMRAITEIARLMSKLGQDNETFTDAETIVNNLFSKQPLKRKRTPLRLKLKGEGLGTLSRQLETKIEGVTEKIAGRVEKFKDDITQNARRVRFQFTERAKKAREKIEKIREKIDKFQFHHLKLRQSNTTSEVALGSSGDTSDLTLEKTETTSPRQEMTNAGVSPRTNELRKEKLNNAQREDIEESNRQSKTEQNLSITQQQTSSNNIKNTPSSSHLSNSQNDTNNTNSSTSSQFLTLHNNDKTLSTNKNKLDSVLSKLEYLIDITQKPIDKIQTNSLDNVDHNRNEVNDINVTVEVKKERIVPLTEQSNKTSKISEISKRKSTRRRSLSRIDSRRLQRRETEHSHNFTTLSLPSKESRETLWSLTESSLNEKTHSILVRETNHQEKEEERESTTNGNTSKREKKWRKYRHSLTPKKNETDESFEWTTEMTTTTSEKNEERKKIQQFETKSEKITKKEKSTTKAESIENVQTKSTKRLHRRTMSDYIPSSNFTKQQKKKQKKQKKKRESIRNEKESSFFTPRTSLDSEWSLSTDLHSGDSTQHLGGDLLTISSVYDIGRDRPKDTKLKKAKSFYVSSLFGDETSLDIRDKNLDIDTHYYHDENDSDNDMDIDSESEHTETSEERNVVTEGYDTQKTRTKKALSVSEFTARAVHEADFANCLGLFDYIHKKFVSPLEHKVHQKLRRPELSGVLKKKRSHANAWWLKGDAAFVTRHYLVRGGYFVCFNDAKQKKPVKSISLTSAAVKKGKKKTTFHFKGPDGVSIKLYAANRKERDQWVNAIRANITGVNRYRSFAPIRKKIQCQWFVNGKEYFAALRDVLKTAKIRIFVTDWFFSPGLYLTREDPLNQEDRLDRLLLAKAKQGVKIYILIWHNSTIGGTHLKSDYVVKYMETLHKNIFTLDHPYIKPILWTHHQKMVVVDDEIAFLGGIDLCYGRYDDSNYRLTDPEGKIFPGRDYSHLYLGEKNGPTKEEVLDRTKQWRLPWHDVQVAVTGLAARDVAFNFIERWNTAYQTLPLYARAKLITRRYHLLVPLPDKVPTSAQLCESFPIYHNLNCQVVRSVAHWSCGVPQPESSIYKATLSIIKEAKYYIYIENQFFISAIDTHIPKNKIAKALYLRIRKAILNKEPFHVYILLPIYPSGDLQSQTTLYILKYVYRTLIRGRHSLLWHLQQEFDENVISDYLSFFCLRTHALLDGKPVTEQIYMHAKVMIVDDRVALIGSANFNDRSMRGTRDSEIGVVIEQTSDLMESVMAGKPFKVSKFVYELRMRLWRDFLGLTPNEEVEIIDPVHQRTIDLWKRRAKDNTRYYQKIWPVLHNNLYKLTQLSEMVPNEENYKKYSSKIKGFVVDFPYDFLRDEDLNFSPFAKEQMVPKSVFL